MIVSGGKLIAIDSVRTDQRSILGDGVKTPLQFNISAGEGIEILYDESVSSYKIHSSASIDLSNTLSISAASAISAQLSSDILAISSNYLTSSDLNGFLTRTSADSLYQPIGNYITDLPNSANWDYTVNTVSSNSAKWDNTYNNLSYNSANWDNTQAILSSNSAKWDKVYSSVNGSSAEWDNTQAIVSSNSAKWDDTHTNLSSNSAKWDDTHTNLSSNSAKWDNTHTNLSSNSAKWDNVYSSVNGSSAKWDNTHTNLSSNSAKWDNTHTSLSSNSAKWDNTYTNLSSNSASWGNTQAIVSSNSAKWDNTYTNLSSNSAKWDNVYSSVNGSSAKWDDTYTNLSSNSAKWDNVYSSVNGSSAEWDNTQVIVSSNSAKWDDTYTNLSSNSAKWDNVYSSVNGSSAKWDNTYTNLSSNSAKWDNVYSSVNGSSADWNEVSGKQDILFLGDTLSGSGTSASPLQAKPVQIVSNNGSITVSSNVLSGTSIFNIEAVSGVSGSSLSLAYTMPIAAATQNVALNAGTSTQWAAHATLITPFNNAILSSNSKIKISMPQVVSSGSLIFGLYTYSVDSDNNDIILTHKRSTNIIPMPSADSFIEYKLENGISTNLNASDLNYLVVLTNSNGCAVKGTAGNNANFRPFTSMIRNNLGTLPSAPFEIIIDGETSLNIYAEIIF